MFNLAPTETFKHEVKVQTKTESGSWREESFVGVFVRTPEDRRMELNDKTYAKLVDEVLIGWEMKDLQRLPVEFTPENKAAFLSIPAAVRETAVAYIGANAGAKVKN